MTIVGESRSTEAARSPGGRILLERLRKRESTVLDEIARVFGGPLSRAAWVYLGDRHTAEDAVQDTLLAAWKGARRTGAETELRPWLFGILFHVCRRHRRTAARRRRREERAATAVREASSDESGKDPAFLRRALASLKPEVREVIVLRFLEGFGVAETGTALSIPPGTVKSRCHYGLARLKEIMERDELA